MSKRRGSGSNNRKWRARAEATHLRVDFQVEFAHARDDGFSALCVKVHSKGRIFFGESVNSFGEFILIILARGKVINLGLSRGRSAFYLRYKLKYVRTLLEGLIAMEMTGSGTWIDSCWMNIRQDYSSLSETWTNDSKTCWNEHDSWLSAHHGEVGVGLGCKSVSARTVDPKKSANISWINLFHILKWKKVSCFWLEA